MSKKMPFLYKKLLSMIIGTAELGKTNTNRINQELGLRFRISSKDTEICLSELKKMDLIAIQRGRRGRQVEINPNIKV